MKRMYLVGILAATGALAQPPAPPTPPNPPQHSIPEGMRSGSEDRLYAQAARLLQQREWEAAAKRYEEVLKLQGARSEAAGYWQAYALHKAGRAEAAMNAVQELYRKNPGGRWINDAKALEMEIRRSAGQPASPESQDDEELKLMAVATLMSSEPARAVPLLEKVIFGTGSVRLKEQALFVLAQKRSPESRSILTKIARGGANPDLQSRAIEWLGAQGGAENAALLGELYSEIQDPALRRRVLHGLGMSKASDKLLDIVKSEQDPSLRREAIHMLAFQSKSLTPEMTRSLYAAEKDRSIRRELLNVMAVRKDSQSLLEIARSEKDMGLRREAMERLRVSDPKAAEDLLMEILQK